MKKYILLISLLLFSLPSYAQDYGFQNWLRNFEIRAQQHGIYPSTLRSALSDIEPIDRVIELDRAQPEQRMKFPQYLSSTVNAQRIEKGRALKEDYADLLNNVYARSGVPPHILLALWGKESNYGTYQGKFPLIASLATLAYEGRRAAFFEKELIAALKIIQTQGFNAPDITGSWAGAMGQTQFMPTTYLNYAVDGDGDNIIDIWNSVPDALSSMANYLKAEGWREGELWGRAVQLPHHFNMNLLGRNHRRSVSEWARLGVKKASGQALPPGTVQGYLIASDPGDDVYLVYHNYDVLLRWNRSRYFGLAVGILSDRIGL